MSPWFVRAIALVRLREAGTEVTDEMVLAECEIAGIDPTPVMIVVQHKAPAAWGAFYDDPDGPRRIVGMRLIGVWFKLPCRERVLIETPEAQEAIEMLMKLDGMPAPRCYALAPWPLTIHPSEIR